MAGGDIEPRLHNGLKEAESLISKVNSLGVVTDNLLRDLQVAGVKSFADSYKELLASIDTKRQNI